MTSTIIAGVLTLIPIAAVDTSSATNGVSMYSLTIPAEILPNNLIQIEYFISKKDELLHISNGNGFISFGEGISYTGISNALQIPIPSIINDILDEYEVKVRAYFGLAENIGVTNWSNACPAHKPPDKPIISNAYILRSETDVYDLNDVLYVQIPTASDPDANARFIVSYSYIDQDNTNRWIVSQLLSYAYDSTLKTLLLDPIILNSDVLHTSQINVAVNGVLRYNFNGINYFTISEISTTVAAKNAEAGAPMLYPIYFTSADVTSNNASSYSVYSDGTQIVRLVWTAATVTAIPNYSVASYEINVYIGDNVIDTISNLSSTISKYSYSIPVEHTSSDVPSQQFEFIVSAIGIAGNVDNSVSQYVNTFTRAASPTNVIVAWANKGSTAINNLQTVDMMVTFNNPEYFGQGSPHQFVIDVYDENNNIVSSSNQTVAYSSTANKYIVYLNESATTSVGNVTVYMLTTDTNTATYIKGATATAAYVLSDSSVISNVFNDADKFGFDVVTDIPLSKQGIIWTSDNRKLTFLTTTGDNNLPDSNVLGYTVTLTNTLLDDFGYNFVFYTSFRTYYNITSMTIYVANPDGITSVQIDEFVAM